MLLFNLKLCCPYHVCDIFVSINLLPYYIIMYLTRDITIQLLPYYMFHVIKKACHYSLWLFYPYCVFDMEYRHSIMISLSVTFIWHGISLFIHDCTIYTMYLYLPGNVSITLCLYSMYHITDRGSYFVSEYTICTM